MNSNNQKIILITGSNKGIGFGTIQQLLKKNGNYQIITTSRNEDLGKKSLASLLKQFPSAASKLTYCQLDITQKASITKCIEFIKEKFGQIDILINNAGVHDQSNPLEYNMTFKINVFGTIDISQQFLESNIIKKGGKIIFLGSQLGTISCLSNSSLRQRFKDPNLTLPELLALADEFKKSILANKCKQDGWPTQSNYYASYSVSKLIINTIPQIFIKQENVINNDIGVYSCCPGWVRTDMGGSSATFSIEEGTEMPIYLIELKNGLVPNLQGKFFRYCKPVSF